MFESKNCLEKAYEKEIKLTRTLTLLALREVFSTFCLPVDNFLSFGLIATKFGDFS